MRRGPRWWTLLNQKRADLIRKHDDAKAEEKRELHLLEQVADLCLDHWHPLNCITEEGLRLRAGLPERSLREKAWSAVYEFCPHLKDVRNLSIAEAMQDASHWCFVNQRTEGPDTRNLRKAIKHLEEHGWV